MLTPFGRDRRPVAIEANAERSGREAFVAHVAGYRGRHRAPDLRAALERHPIECGPGQRAVPIGRVANRLNHHNISVGKPCAAHTRRNS
ncbi:MAG TPA: hypothetical protein VG994_14615 [Steroidobacteraceae bacterium]|nr:hypothetical protein [Steroidobacteraceae bacterium]